MSAKEALEALWSAYQIKRNSTTLSEYMVEFRRQYGDCLKTDFPANPSRSITSPHLIDLPEGFLQVVESYLRECSDDCNTGVTVETVQKAVVAVQVLSILSRNFSNIPFVSTSEAVPLVIVISSAVANQYTQHSKDAKDQNTTGFLLSVLIFLEVLYDPHLIWQKMCAKVPLESTKYKVSPSHLHLEVIPFFYDCLSSKPCFLPASIQMKLIHVFGAIICGAQHNAQVAINQNTVEILFHRLREQECPLEVKMTAVRCILQGIVTLCASPPEARKVDLNAFVREYLGTLSKLMTEEERPTQVDTAQWMMSGLQELFSSNCTLALKKVFHDNELVERLIRSLHGTKLKSSSAQKIATSSVRLIHVFLSNYPFAKKHFSSMQGCRTLISTLKTMGEPQQSTLETLLEWLVEETPRLTGTSTLRNLELMIHLLHWLPQLESHALQLWLAEQLDSMVKGSLRSRMDCARGGVIPAVIHVLSRSSTIGGKAVGQLLKFLVTLGSCSISTSELKALFHLLRPNSSGEQHQYTLPLMYALSSMVKSDGWLGACHFFDFRNPDEGIVIPNIKKWPGSGFAFHAWLRLEKLNVRKEAPFRRQLYSFTTANGSLESFFTAQGKLVVAVSTKKDYYAIPVEGITLDDETWHSVDVCHTPARRPFTNSTMSVFIDGRQRVSVQVKLPSLSEFSQCHVACGNSNEPTTPTSERRAASSRASGDSTTSGMLPEHGLGGSEEHPGQGVAGSGGFLRNSALGSFLSGWDTDKIFSMAPSVPVNLRSAFNADPDPSVSVTPLESHEQVWGLSRGLKGQIGSLCLFSEPLQASQVKMMYTGGPRNYTLFKNEDSVEVSELLGKLVLYYDAKASLDGTCTNLAPTLSLYDGTVRGRYCHTQNVKDTINLIGGFPTLYVLLENSGKPIPKCSPSFETPCTPSNHRASEELVDDWIVVPSSSSSFSGHIQYLTTIIKEDRKYFRKKYGPRFLLDMVQMFYSDCSLLSSDDVKTIRMAVLSLVKFYMMRDVSIQDVSAVVSYVLSQRKEELLIQALLRSDKVYEKSKSRLRLAEVGFASLTGLMSSNDVTSEVARELVNLILMSGQANATHAENASELMKLVFDFVCHENVEDESRLSEKLLEHVLMVMDLLMVFGESPGDEGWEEMSKLALGILLVCAGSHKLELCAMATARLHTLVQTRPFASLEESCYLLTGVNAVLARAVKDGDQEQYSFVIPVVRALLERVGLRLRAWQHLPSQPNMDAGPAFFDQFQKYALTSEWSSFVSNVVKPVQEQYGSMLIREQHEAMNGFWNQCYEGIMVAMHKRSRGVGESKLRFQSQVLSAFQSRLVEEQQRILAVQTNLRNQHLFICRRWKATKLFLTGPCGPWSSSINKPLYWKLSQQENFARMRLKLTLNHNFDSHYQASCLRDNQGILTNQSTSWLPPISAEARAMLQKEDFVAEEDIQALQGQVQDLEHPEGTIDKKKPVIEEDCELVTLMKVVKGRFEVTATQIYFIDLSPVREEGERHDFTYPLHMLREVHLRRYNLRRSALEFFLVDQTNFFLNFTTKTRNKIFGRVVALHPPNLLYSSGTRSPAELLRASGLTQRWVNREISNFEYLMHLNTIAGRTYNDLSQYPVFPWILADYTSPKLDFEDPAIYRELSRPIGIINPKNIEEVKAKYDSFVDITGTVEKFHYGTHYSNSAGVLHYLVRLEPFTSLHIELQSGRFDVADRQFHSFEGTWKMLMESPNDVKELIPEFFYLPEFLTNMNGFDLGRLQGTKEQVDDVRLPAWASSPEDFIYKHRKALESEYVSLHLHEWIDLIFGYKQKGPAAVEALNVFYYVSYEGAVDLDAIKDPVQREATEGIINNFGQTPCQLLKEPHPRRLSHEGALLRMTKSDTKPPNLFLFLQNLKAYVVDAPLSCPVVHVNIPKSPARSFMQHGLMDTLVTVGCDGSLGVHGWLPYDRTRSYPNYFTFEKDLNLQNPKSAKKLAGVFQPGAKVHSRLFVLSSDGKFLVSGGHWDNSVRAYSLLRSKQVAHVILHKDVVTSLATDNCGMYLMTGSRDTTCIIWELNQLGSGSFLPDKPFQILCGHDSEVTCVAVITELDMALSGSKDGTVNVHSVREGHFLHTLRLPGDLPEQVALLSVSHLGFICVHSCPDPHALLKSGYVLHLYTINGKYLLRKEVSRAISDMTVCDDFLITGDEDGLLVIYELFGLAEKVSLPLCSPILTVVRTPTNSHLICSLGNGKLVVIGISTSSLRSS
ncbi:hypothetical protein V5799_012829 [Amblyomma americanum]|uniref:Uncharacterized protein n=1 Tax=Amblyomma americanum TaxID=6943 RepID=A0AAQ4E7K9_AMBAM